MPKNENSSSCSNCHYSCSPGYKYCPQCGQNLTERDVYTENEFLQHISNKSSAKLGICLTLLGLIKVVEGTKHTTFIIDELIAITALGFLVATFLTFNALKQVSLPSKHRIGKMADRVFSLSLVSLLLLSGMLACEIM